MQDLLENARSGKTKRSMSFFFISECSMIKSARSILSSISSTLPLFGANYCQLAGGIWDRSVYALEGKRFSLWARIAMFKALRVGEVK
jgi:hypothetical protein